MEGQESKLEPCSECEMHDNCNVVGFRKQIAALEARLSEMHHGPPITKCISEEQYRDLQARNKELEKLNSLRITLDYEGKIAALKNQIVYTASGEMKAGEMGLKIQELEKRNAENEEHIKGLDEQLCDSENSERDLFQKLKAAEDALASVTKEKEFLHRELTKPKDNAPF